ncbi:MAG: FlgD immunoglobulin-like domain containing protein [Bacteroidota bacterium]
MMSRGVSMVVRPNGDVFACWALFLADGAQFGEMGIGYTRSTNGGATWSPTQTIPTTELAGINGDLLKGPQDLTIAVNSHPSVAYDPVDSLLYVVWANRKSPCEEQSPTEQMLPDIWMIQSTDFGTSWQQDRRISPLDECPRTDQWSPRVHVDQGGGVNVVYYDSEIDPAENDYTQVTLARSIDHGQSWKYFQISDYKWIPGPVAGSQNYGGESIGLSSTSDYLIIAWNDNRTGAHQTYTARFPLTQTNIITSVNAGYNMTGIPVIANNFAKTVVYSGASHVYKYTPGGYALADSLLSCNQGWWVRFSQSQMLLYSGLVVESMGMTVHAGWNIVGSISASVDVTTVTSDPPGILDSQFFTYAGGYQVADVLSPGGGYWVKASEAGTLFFDGEFDGGQIESLFEGYDRFTVTDAEGHSQALYVRNHSLIPPGSIPDIEMPPAAPFSFDARFVSDKMLESVSADSGAVTLYITMDSAVAPIELSWDINPENEIEYNLVGPLGKPSSLGTGNLSGRIRFSSGVNTIPITALARNGNIDTFAPEESALHQNYPNPFNPETEIRFDVAEAGIITIGVYDILGRLVRTLSSGEYKPGSFAVKWNGRDEQNNAVASGLYLYRMIQGSSILIRKMVLVR